MAFLRRLWILSVVICCSLANPVTGEAMSAIKYDVLQTELSILFKLTCDTPVRSNGLLVQMTCVDPTTKEVTKLDYQKDPSGLGTVFWQGNSYLVVDNFDGKGNVFSMKTLQITENGISKFYVLDPNKEFILCVATLDGSVKLVLTPAIRQTTGYIPPSVILTLQESILLKKICTVPLPEQLNESSVKIKVDSSGGLLLISNFNFRKGDGKSVTYSIAEDKTTGILTIVESEKGYFIEIDNAVAIGVKNFVRSTSADQPIVYSIDDKGNLGITYYDETRANTDTIPVDIVSWNVIPRSLSVPSQNYEVLMSASMEPLPEQFGASTAKSITTDSNGDVVLRCKNSATQQVFVNKLSWITNSKVLVFEIDKVVFLVAGTGTATITVSVGVRGQHGEQIVVLVANENKQLCTVWYNNEGTVQLIPVIKLSGSTGFTSGSITMPPQEYAAYQLQFDGPIPSQFPDIAVKKITSDDKGNLRFACTNPNTQQKLEYDLDFIELFGFYAIQDSGTKYVVIVSNSHMTVKKIIPYTTGKLSFMLTIDNFGNLCTVSYDEYLDTVKQTEVGRQAMDCTNDRVTLDEKDYNTKFDICNKGLADQFANFTPKTMITDEKGSLTLLCQYKRVKLMYPTDVEDTTGFLNFLYKGNQYMVIINGKTVSTKNTFKATIVGRTVMYTLDDDAKQLCIASYDCHNNVIFTPVSKRKKQT